MTTARLDHATLVEHDRKQLHPLQHPSQHADPLVVDHAEGVWLYTTDGRKVLDGMAGLWNVNIGYGNQELPDVAAAQMRKVAYTSNFVGMTTQPAAELAYRMAGMAHPTLNTTFFASGGSEANDTAFKTVRYYWYRLGRKDKFKIIARRGAYHGITVAATAATGIPRYQTMFGPMAPGFLHIPAPNPYRYDGDRRPDETVGQAAARALEEAILREGPETVAAFIAEPIQGVGGVIVPPDDYFPLVRAICDKYDVLLIADEVICGFGRTGKWFGEQHWNLRPDIISFAKESPAAICNWVATRSPTRSVRSSTAHLWRSSGCMATLTPVMPRLVRWVSRIWRSSSARTCWATASAWAIACRPDWRNCSISRLWAKCAGAACCAAWTSSRARRRVRRTRRKQRRSTTPAWRAGCVRATWATRWPLHRHWSSTPTRWIRSSKSSAA